MGLKVRTKSRCGGEGEVRLVKHNMSGDKNPTRCEIIATVALMVRGVTKEHTTCRARCELVRSSGGKIRVARAPEDMKVSVCGRGTEESMVRSRNWGGSRSKTVNQVGGGVETLNPKP
jgi:hypothetical protein